MYKHTDRSVCKGVFILNTRENIIKAAFKLFLERGYNGVSINDVLKETELTKGGLYYYFVGKKELFAEVTIYYVISPMQEFQRYIENQNYTNVADLLNTLFNSYIYMVEQMIEVVQEESKANGYYLIMFDAKNNVESFSKDIEEIYVGLRKAVEDWLSKAMSNGEIKQTTNCSEISYFIISLCEGICIQWILNKEVNYKDAYLNALENLKCMLGIQ